MFVILFVGPLVSGCAEPTSDAPVATPELMVLPPGASLEGGRLVRQTGSEITFRWSGLTDKTVAVGAPPDPRNRLQTTLQLPPDVTLEVVAQRLPGPGEEAATMRGEDHVLATTLIDSGGYHRCNGRGPGTGAEWREVCRVRPVGPYAEPATWTVRVEASDTGGPVPFEMDVTIRALAPASLSSLRSVTPFEARAKDSTVLRGHVYLPEGNGPFATVLVYSPYWNQGGSVNSDGLARTYEGRQTLVRPWGPFLDAGFAVAAVNIRGTGASDGCYEYMNHPRNGPDANAVVDAIATQPWSNGRVGMYGISYMAATQLAAIAHSPSPHLAAIVPISGEWDEWNFLAIWGAAYRGAESHPTSRNLQQGMGLASAIGGAEGLSPTAPSPTPQHWCQDTAVSQANWDQLIVSGDKTPWLQARDLRAGIQNSLVPMLLTNGLTDGESGHRSTPYDLWDLVGAPQRWVLSQNGHCPPGCDYIQFAWDHAVPWFDHYLRGGPALETGVVEFQDDSRRWSRATSWPPRGTSLELFLSERRLVNESGLVRASQQRAVNNDAETAGPTDCDVAAIYVSDPFDHETVLAGEFRLNFTVSSSAPNGNVAAYLFRSSADPGCVTQLPGAAGGAHLIRYALSDLRHRGHVEQGTDATPGQNLGMQMRSYPFAARVPAGERLVLVIASGHPDLVPKPYQPVLTLTHGPQIDGRLVLTMMES